MDPGAKGKFLTKISINGFSIEEKEGRLILRPRGSEATAEVVIEESESAVWKVLTASGSYSAFARGKKRQYFEDYINRWAQEALLQVPG